ncbi:MAG: class I SAM-dependent methyltransferase, partial [Pseudomonadota bacterium]
MPSWKIKLYETYVTTQQSAASNQNIDEIQLSRFPQYRHIISNYLPPDKTTRIADLGCGYGQLLFCLKAMGYTNIDGVDASSEQVKIAHQLGLKEVRQGDLTGFLNEVSGKYDVIFLMDVLEHMQKHEVINILELIGNTLSEQGQLVIH